MAGAFDARAVRAELEALQAKLHRLEAEGADDEEILDLACEANELRDQLRNHESFPAFWPHPPSGAGDGGAGGAAATALLAAAAPAACWRLPGLVAASELAGLLAAVREPPGFGTPEEEGWVADGRRRGEDPEAYRGGLRRSDDPAFGAELWRRVQGLVPQRLGAVLAPARDACFRTSLWPDFPWQGTWVPVGVDVRIVYEELPETSPAEDWRLDTQEADDRDEGWRPLLTLLLLLGPGPAQVFFEGGPHQRQPEPQQPQPPPPVLQDAAEPGRVEPLEPWTVDLLPGDAALFARGDPCCAYRLAPAGPAAAAAVVGHARVLYRVEPGGGDG